MTSLPIEDPQAWLLAAGTPGRYAFVFDTDRDARPLFAALRRAAREHGREIRRVTRAVNAYWFDVA